MPLINVCFVNRDTINSLLVGGKMQNVYNTHDPNCSKTLPKNIIFDTIILILMHCSFLLAEMASYGSTTLFMGVILEEHS